MATEQLQINNWNSGWPTGLVTNVDEPSASADGQVVSTSTHNQTVIFGIEPPSVIQDVDDVTGINLVIRTRAITILGSPTAKLKVELFVGGVSKGSVTTSDLADNIMINLHLSLGSWDADWTRAELDSITIHVTTITDPTSINSVAQYDIDTIDVVVTYTDVPPFSFTPTTAALNLVGKVPVSDLSDLFHLSQPAPALLTLTGVAPFSSPVVLPPAAALSFNERLVYVNPLIERLQVNDWDAGWAEGLVTNIDEPVAEADGQTISTLESTFPNSLELFFEPSGLSDNDVVLTLEFVARIKLETLGAPITECQMIFTPEPFGNRPSIVVDVISAVDNFVNFSLTRPEWDGDISAAALDALSLQITVTGFATPDDFRIHIDTVDAIITFAPSPSHRIEVVVGALSLAGKLPAVLDSRIKAPTTGAVVLAGKTSTLFREDNAQVSADILILSGKAPSIIGDHVTLPAVGTLALVSGALTLNLSMLPAVNALVLAGKVPTFIATGNHTRPIRRVFVLLWEEAPLSEHSPDLVDGPGRMLTNFNPKAVTLDQTFNHFPLPAAGTLILAPQLASLDSHTVIPAIDSLALAGQAPIASIGKSLLVTEGTLVFGTYVPLPAEVFTELTITGYAPFIGENYPLNPAVTSLAFTSYVPLSLVASISPLATALTLSGYAVTLEIDTPLVTGLPRLISITVDRKIEFIATPTDLLIG